MKMNYGKSIILDEDEIIELARIMYLNQRYALIYRSIPQNDNNKNKWEILLNNAYWAYKCVMLNIAEKYKLNYSALITNSRINIEDNLLIIGE